MQEDRLYDEALEATFITDKADVCRRLADLGTPESVETLLRLLDDDNSWNQQGAVAGLATLAEPAVTRALVDRLSDHMIDDAVRGALSDHIDLHADTLTQLYLDSEGERAEELLKLLGTSTRGAAFLMAEIETGERKAEALQLLSAHHPQGNTPYLLQFLDQPEHTTTVLAHLVHHGGPEHLPHFLALLEEEAPDEQLILAFEAVARWGDAEQAQRVCEWGLTRGEGIAQAAIAAFGELESPVICTHLARWMTEGEPKTRMLAAERLAAQGTIEHVPLLISFLNDEWTGKQRGFLDGILGVLTVGIVPLLQQVGEHMSRRRLEEAQDRVAIDLQRLTGHRAGNDYRAWRRWGIERGYTIDGTNLLQELFSSDPAVRQNAEESAAALLQRQPATDDPHRRLLDLAEGLLARGVLG